MIFLRASVPGPPLPCRAASVASLPGGLLGDKSRVLVSDWLICHVVVAPSNNLALADRWGRPEANKNSAILLNEVFWASRLLPDSPSGRPS